MKIVHSGARMKLDVPRCEELVGALVSGDATAWKPLVVLIGPALLSFSATSRVLGHRRGDEDTQRELLVAVLETLRKNDFQALKTYRSWRAAPENSQKTLEDWLRIILTNEARDYVTHRMRRSALNTLSIALDTGTALEWSGMTNAQAVRQLLQHADDHLPPEQAETLRRVFEGKSIEEVAHLSGESKGVIEKRLRAAYARLRRWAGGNDTETAA